MERKTACIGGMFLLGLGILWFTSLSYSTPTGPLEGKGGLGNVAQAAAEKGEQTPPKPATLVFTPPKGKSCVTGQCHDNMGKEKYVHGPVAAGACTECHIPTDPEGAYDVKKHRFELAGGERGLCYKCHERKDTQKVVHGPVKFGLCSACHDPHQSPYKYRLKRWPARELCFKCHVNDKTVEKEVHGPVAAGDCIACHDPHTTPYPYRLISWGPDLCYTCHTEKKEDFSARRFGHPPAQHDCNNCHDPHNSPNPYRWHRPIPELCLGCHVDKKDHIRTVRTEHDCYKIEKKCLNCHDPHFTDYPKQLLDVPMNLCFKCHDRPQKAPDRMLINMKEWLSNNHDWHGPIRQRDCPGCHNPHGSDNFRLLKRSFPPDFYTGFALEKYGLCFGCHEKTLVLDQFTTTLTGFRNGDQNLHFHHVNRVTKGRTCRACHELHASNNPKHIRDSVPFGAWELPTNYVKYESGGKCAPGCHVPRGYNRVKKVQNPIDYKTFKAE